MTGPDAGHCVRRPLSYYGGRIVSSRASSTWQHAAVEELTEEEAGPSCVCRSIPAGRNRRWGGRSGAGPQARRTKPLRVTDGSLLRLRAQVAGRNEAWVRTQFQRQASEHRGFRVATQRLAAWLLMAAPVGLGASGLAGARQDEIRNWLVGAVIVLLVILALTRVLSVQGFLRWLTTALGWAEASMTGCAGTSGLPGGGVHPAPLLGVLQALHLGRHCAASILTSPHTVTHSGCGETSVRILLWLDMRPGAPACAVTPILAVLVVGWLLRWQAGLSAG